MSHICHSRFIRSFLIVIPLIFISNSSCSPEEEISEVHENINKISKLTEKDVPYGEHSGQVYDLYLPAERSSSKTKVLVFIHGGGWIGGDKVDMEQYLPLLQRAHPHHAIVNLNYSLAQIPHRPAFPNQFLDIQQALRQITERAEDLKIKPEFGIIGVSAGAHLALQYDALYDMDDQVKMVCSIVGPTDLSDPLYRNNKDFDLAIDYLVDENAYLGTKEFARAVSPFYHISNKSSATILFYGEEDELVPIRSGIAFKEKLDSVGISNSLTIFSGGHGDWEKEENQTLQVKLKEFIDLHLFVN